MLKEKFKFRLTGIEDSTTPDTNLIHSAEIDGEDVHVVWHPEQVAHVIELDGEEPWTKTLTDYVNLWIEIGAWEIVNEDKETV